MLFTRRLAFLTRILCLFSVCSWSWAGFANAEIVTWVGATDGNWSAAGNWTGVNTPPLASDQLVFSGNTNLSTNNDLTPGIVFDQITFDDSGGAAGDFVLAGNSITSNGNITVKTADASTQTISLDIATPSGLAVGVDVAGAAAVGNRLVLSGVISGAGSLTLDDDLGVTSSSGGGLVQLSGDNTFSGGTVIEESVLLATHNNALGTGAVTIHDLADAIASDPELRVANGVIIGNDLTISNQGSDKRLGLAGGTGNSGGFSGTITINESTSGNFELSAGGSESNDATQLLTLSGKVTGTGIDASEIAIRITGGDGTVVLSNSANDFTGDISVDQNGGTLRITNDAALSDADLIINQTNSHVELADGVTVDNSLIINDANAHGKRLKLQAGSGLSATYSGTIQVDESGANNFDIDANSTGGNNDQTQILTVSGSITSTAGAGIEIIGDGVVRLSAANDISDTIAMKNEGSILRVGHNDALGGAGGATVSQNHQDTRLQIEDGIVTHWANGLIIGNTSGSKILEIFDASSGGAESATFGGDISIEETTPGNFQIHVSDSLDTLTVAGKISGNGGTSGVSKTGLGTVVLSGANTYTGATFVSSGVLAINGDNSAASGAVTVAAGATLAGTGAVGGATTISGTHAPGASAGLQTFTDLAYDSDSVLIWELVRNADGDTNAGIRGTDWDGVTVNGALTIDAAAMSILVFDSAGSTVDFSDSFWDSDQSWLVFSGATSLLGQFADPATPAGLTSKGSFAWTNSGGNDLSLNFTATAVPEPRTIVMLAIGVLVLGLRHRRAKTRRDPAAG